MKDKITTNLVGVIPTEKIKNTIKNFNPFKYNVDDVIEELLRKTGGDWIIAEILNQFNNSTLRIAQEVSLNYFLGNNDIRKSRKGDDVLIFNPFTGLYQSTQNPNSYISKRIASSFHKNVVSELTNFTLGSKPIEIKVDKDEEPSDNTLKVFNKFNKRWNDSNELDRTSIKDFLVFGFSGIKWTPYEAKDYLGKDEWVFRGERIEPSNVWTFTLGRIENKLNNSDVVVSYNVKADGLTIEIEAELYTNKAVYTLNHFESEKNGGEKTFNYKRQALWIKETEEVDMLRPPFSFMEPEDYSQLIISDYKGMIDAEDELINSTINDSIYHDESLLFIKGEGFGFGFKSALNEELKALNKERPENQKGYKAIYSSSNDTEITNLSNDLPTAHTELSFKILEDKMYNASSTFNYNLSSTNENYNAIKKGYNKILNKIYPIREKLTNQKKESLKLLTVFIAKLDKSVAKEIDERIDNIIIEYDNGFIINELDQANALATSVGAGFLSKETASEITSFGTKDELKRVSKQEEKIKEEIDEKNKTLQINEPKDGERQGGATSGDVRQMK